MENLPFAVVLAVRGTRHQAWSALPDAPVVPDEPRRTRPARTPHAARSRTVLATLLERAARAVAPAPCSPAR